MFNLDFIPTPEGVSSYSALVKINNFSVTTHKINKPCRGKIKSNRFVPINNIRIGKFPDADISLFNTKIFSFKHFNFLPKIF